MSFGTSTPGLFGSKLNSTNATGNTTNTFGQSIPSNTTNSSLFGQSAPNTGQSALNSGQTVSSATTLQSNSGPPNSTISAPTGSISSKTSDEKKSFITPASAMLNELLEASRNLPSTGSDYGSVLLDLQEISKRAKTLRKEIKNDDNDTKAHYLLAGSGVNAEDIASDLGQLMVRQNVQQSTFSTDQMSLDTFLRAKKEENILAAIEESVNFASKEYDWFLSQNLNVDWRVRKNEIYAQFGLVKSTENDSINEKSSKNDIAPIWGKVSLGRRILGPLNGNSEFTDVTFFQPNTGTEYSQSNSTLVDIDKDEAASVGLDLVGNNNIYTSGPQYNIAISSAELRSKKQAVIINKLNDYRQNDRLMPVALEFASISKDHTSDIQSQHIYDAWKILAEIVGETEDSNIPPRFFAQFYSTKDPRNDKTILMRKRIITGTRKYLGNQFFEYIDDSIAASPQDARLGGVPSVLNKIKAYVNLRFLRAGSWHPNLQLVNGLPFWAIVFYLIRCGEYQVAMNFVLDNETGLDQIERSFVEYIVSYAKSKDQEVSGELLGALDTDFNQRIANFDQRSDDPFKYTVYKIIGRCALGRKQFPSEVIATTEDWIWAQYMLLKEGEQESIPINERYDLNDLQRTVIEFGDSHFNPQKSNPGLYFKLLLLAGLFEWAVHYCYSFSKSDAVHFAIALDYYGLVKVVTDSKKIGSRLVVSDFWNGEESDADMNDISNDSHPALNLPRLIGHYTESFRKSDPRIAVDYIVLLGMNNDLPGSDGKAYLTFCHEALRELVLETREFAVLLGDILTDGSRIPGAIEARLSLISPNNSQDYLHTIAEQAAAKADEDGRTADAVLLYQLAEEYDTVMTIINKAVGETLLLSDLGKPVDDIPDGASMVIAVTDNPSQVARSILATYQANPGIISNVSLKNQETCQSLLRIVDARDNFSRGEWELCLKNISNSGILSVNPGANLSSVRTKAQQFLSLDDSISRNVPMILIMAMRCCVLMSQEMSGKEYATNTIAARIGNLRDVARNIMVYAGMIHYRMSREIYSELTRLEVQI